jgi:hypothetical protein
MWKKFNAIHFNFVIKKCCTQSSHYPLIQYIFINSWLVRNTEFANFWRKKCFFKNTIITKNNLTINFPKQCKPISSNKMLFSLILILLLYFFGFRFSCCLFSNFLFSHLSQFTNNWNTTAFLVYCSLFHCGFSASRVFFVEVKFGPKTKAVVSQSLKGFCQDSSSVWNFG